MIAVAINPFGHQPEPSRILEAQLQGYFVLTYRCNHPSCKFPFHTIVAYCHPHDGTEMGHAPKEWNYKSFLAAVGGHHRVVRSLVERKGEAWQSVTGHTCIGGRCDLAALFGEEPRVLTVMDEADRIPAEVFERTQP